MSIPVVVQLDIPSQCDAQKNFMQGAEMDMTPSPAMIDLAVSLIEEEVISELLPAVDHLQGLETSIIVIEASEEERRAIYEDAVTEVADGIVDSIYVLYQLANTLQLPFDRLFELVHLNNMAKLQHGEDGKLLKREDGKLLKPAGHKKPDIKGLLFPKQEVAVKDVPEMP